MLDCILKTLQQPREGEGGSGHQAHIPSPTQMFPEPPRPGPRTGPHTCGAADGLRLRIRSPSLAFKRALKKPDLPNRESEAGAQPRACAPGGGRRGWVVGGRGAEWAALSVMLTSRVPLLSHLELWGFFFFFDV